MKDKEFIKLHRELLTHRRLRDNKILNPVKRTKNFLYGLWIALFTIVPLCIIVLILLAPSLFFEMYPSFDYFFVALLIAAGVSIFFVMIPTIVLIDLIVLPKLVKNQQIDYQLLGDDFLDENPFIR